MVSSEKQKCGCCGALCSRLFCRENDTESEVADEDLPVTLKQLSEARDVVFTQQLAAPLSIGSHILCTGTPDEEIPWFAINIGSGDAEFNKTDIAVHFNVRMPQHYVVRNTRKGGKWGAEETTAFKTFPFKLNRPFTIEVLIDEEQTLFAVDGAHYCGFAHRNPLPFAAAWVQITGIRDAALEVTNADVYPKLAPALEHVRTRSCIESEACGDEPAWCGNMMALLDGGIPEGHQLVLRGRLRPLLHSFAFDLIDAPHEWPHANVHLHVNVRAYVDCQLSRQLVVLNAWLGSWGDERRQRSAKLTPGTKTTFRLVRGPAEWSVYSDDVLIGELEYRAAASAVKALRIRGDFYPEAVYICPYSSSPSI